MTSPLNASIPNTHHVQTDDNSNSFCSQTFPTLLYQSSTSTQTDDFAFHPSLYKCSKSSLTIPSLQHTESPHFFRARSTPAEITLPNSNVYLQTEPSTSMRIEPSLIKPCPNRINHHCQCKSTLRECKAAQRIWSHCYRINVYHEKMSDDDREIEVTYFDGLYTNLCEYFRCETDSDRVPIKSDISESIQYFGGFTMNGKDDFMIDRCHFVLFWKWFCGACHIIKDIYRLWDRKFPLQLNLFMNRAQCQNILQVTPTGTLIMRLSQSQPNGLILCYTEPTFNRTANIRHVLLMRHSPQRYATKGMTEPTDLNSLIRNFVKLKFVYSPQYIYKKSHVF